MPWPWARGAPQNFGVPYNISATAGASDFKFGAQLGFAKEHHKITLKKGTHGPELGKLPEIWGFLFNIFPKAEASDFKFGTQLGFDMVHHKITHRKKWVWPWASGPPQHFGVPL